MNYVSELLPIVWLGVLSGIFFCMALAFLTHAIIEIDEWIEIDNCIKKLFRKKVRYRTNDSNRPIVYYEWLSDYVGTRMVDTRVYQKMRELIDSGSYMWANRDSFYNKLNELWHYYQNLDYYNRMNSMSEWSSMQINQAWVQEINSYNGYVYGSPTTDYVTTSTTTSNWAHEQEVWTWSTNSPHYSQSSEQWIYDDIMNGIMRTERSSSLSKCAEKQFNHLIKITWKRKNWHCLKK